MFYRVSVQEVSLDKSVKGWAKNLPDGSVEIVLCGDSQAVAYVGEWLWAGPPYADVVNVVCEPLDYQQLSEFKIK